MDSLQPKLIVCACGAKIPPGDAAIITCPSCGRVLESSPSTMLAPTVAAHDAVDRHSEEDDVHALDWKIGDVILGRYAVLGHIGEGGMGHVYQVKHLGWNMDLAVKSPKPSVLKRRRGVENFERECETWVNLGLHPHIVTCYYVRRINGIPRVFAEYVKGGSLWDWIQSNRLYKGDAQQATARILDVAIQFAWGLEFAHQQGLVHQDVKPSNVLLSETGSVKVTDFGLTRATAGALAEEDTEHAAEGAAKFAGMTRVYASPEQIRNDPLTPRSDMWGWAVSVLEMFTTRVSWSSGETAPASLKKLADGRYTESEAPPIPDGVVALLRTCFQPDLQQRPADMGEVADSLKQIYGSVVGAKYPRAEPRTAEALADSLNNRAVSLMDLGRTEQAEAVWEQALRADPHHPESVFNAGLHSWRAGKLPDDAYRQRLDDVRRFHPGEPIPDYLMGQFFLEQGNYIAAKRVLRRFREDAHARAEFRRAERIARERRPQTRGFRMEFVGHNDAVTAVVHLPGQKTVVSGSADNTLKLWDRNTGECLRTFEGHQHSVTAVCASPDGQIVFSASRDRTVRGWEAATGRCLRTYESSAGALQCLALTRDGRQIVAGAQDGSLQVWDAITGVCTTRLQAHRVGVLGIAVTGAGRYVFTASPDGIIKRWDIESGTAIAELAGHDGGVTCVAISDDSWLLLSGGVDGTLRLWHTASGTALRVMHGHVGEVSAVAVAADALTALSAGKDGTVRLWELGTGRCLFTFNKHTKAVLGVGWSRDGRVAASAGEDNRVVLWQVHHAESPFVAAPILCQAASSESVLQQGQAFTGFLAAAKQAIEAGNIAAAATDLRRARELPGHRRSPEAIRAWQQLYTRLPRTHLRGIWEEGLITNEGAPIRALRLTRSGRYALLLSGKNALSVWDLVTRQCTRVFDTGTRAIEYVALSTTGHTTITAGWEITAWDSNKGTPRLVFDSKGEVAGTIALSPDGRFLASAQTKTVCLWDMKTGQLLRTLKGHGGDVSALDWTPDGRVLVSGGADKRIVVWDLHKGAARHTLEGHAGSVTAVAVSPNGQQILAGTGTIWSRPGELRLWDCNTGKHIRTMEGHGDSIFSVDWSGDGKFAISGSADKTAILWELSTGKRAHTLEGHTDSVLAARIAGDGRFALTGSKDGTVRLWTLDWDLGERPTDNWDDGALPYLEQFVALTPAHKRSSAHDAAQFQSLWSNDELALLYYQLGCAGYGWLPPAEVERRLTQLARHRSARPAISSERRGSRIFRRLRGD